MSAAEPSRRNDRALFRFALTQHGVVTTAQLTEAGYSRSQVRRRVEAGRLHRLHQGVYAVVPSQLLRSYSFWLAAVLAVGGEGVLSHRSAAANHGLVRTDAHRVHVSTSRGSPRPRAGLVIHRVSLLEPIDVVVINGVPTTSVARTLFDLAGELDARALEAATEEAAVQDEFDGGGGYATVAEQLADQITRNPGRLRAVQRVSRLLAQRSTAAPTWNELETRMLALIRSGGLPDPEVQAWVDLGDGQPMIRPDFVWRDLRLIVETDGFREHGKRAHFERDRFRDQRSAAAGYATVRVTWRQIIEEPRPLIDRLHSVYRQRAQLFARSA